MTSYFYRQATASTLRSNAMNSKQKLNSNPGSNGSKNVFLQTIPLQTFGAFAGPVDYLVEKLRCIDSFDNKCEKSY